MAVITPDTFDPLLRYVGVRLQQGVPIVDADENEREDIRKFEVRAFLKWFVGNGVPQGNDGAFRVEAQGAANDFVIRAGAGPAAAGATPEERGLTAAGRCLVDGMDVLIDADVRFRDQLLHVDAPGSGALATALGVPQIAAVPDLTGAVTVYLDVWERVVTADEVHALVLPGLGIESCARRKREWAVRARAGTDVPAPGQTDFKPHHSYYALARVRRRLGDATVAPDDLTDLRERHLQMLPAALVADTLGGTLADYRRGLNRPLISLRDAVNALLRGELPATPDRAVAPALAVSQLSRFGAVLDGAGAPVALWTGAVSGGGEQVAGARLDPDNVPAGFGAPVALSAGPADALPSAALVPNSNKLVVSYRKGTGVNTNVFFRTGRLSELATATEQTVTTAAGESITSPFTAVVGDWVVHFFHPGTANGLWQYRRFRHTDGQAADATPQKLSTQTVPGGSNFHAQAARDGTGAIWAAFSASAAPLVIQVAQLVPETNVLGTPNKLNAGQGQNNQPFVLCQALAPGAAGNGVVWVFWSADDPAAGGVFFSRFVNAAWEPIKKADNSRAKDTEPCAVEDGDGAVWLFWTSADRNIVYQRRDPVSGEWGPNRRATFSQHDFAPYALLAPNKAIWLFWSSDRDGTTRTYFKRIVPAI